MTKSKKFIIATVSVVLCIGLILAITLPLTIGKKYNFTNLYSKEWFDTTLKQSERETKTHKSTLTKLGTYTPVLNSQSTLSTMLLPIEDSNNPNALGLYNLLSDSVLQLPTENAKINQGTGQIVVNNYAHLSLTYYVFNTDTREYVYIYLPNGTLLYSKEYSIIPVSIINTKIDITYADEYIYSDEMSYTMTIVENNNEETKKITKNGYIFKVEDIETEKFYQKNDKITAEKNTFASIMAERIGLKGYEVGEDSNSRLITSKNGTIKSVFSKDIDDILAITNGDIFYTETTILPASSTSEDYTYLNKNGEKVIYKWKSFDMKTGKVKDIKAKYLLVDSLEIANEGVGFDRVYYAQKINKDKTLGETVAIVVNGKGFVADVSNKCLSLTGIRWIDKNTAIIAKSDGTYAITDKYLNTKLDLSGLGINYIDLASKTIMAGQTINGKTKYGIINTKGKVLVPFEFAEGTFENNFAIMQTENSFVVYDLNSFSPKTIEATDFNNQTGLFVNETTNYVTGDEIITYRDITGETIFEDKKAQPLDTISIMYCDAKLCVFYSSTGTITYKLYC